MKWRIIENNVYEVEAETEDKAVWTIGGCPQEDLYRYRTDGSFTVEPLAPRAEQPLCTDGFHHCGHWRDGEACCACGDERDEQEG